VLLRLRPLQLQALPRVANRGDEKALAPVMKLLEAVQGHERGDIFYPHLSHKLSKHAVRALGTLAGRGNEVVLKALHVRILDDPEPSVREAAARSIGNLADADDARSVAALYLCMEDEDEQVRRAAAKSTRTMMKRMREVNVQTEEDEDQDEVEGECGASRLWLLPGMWGG
jgi:HEAT repeat protein